MIKDSGERVQMAGMVRDTSKDKTRFDLVFDGPMFKRWAEHLTLGAKKYTARNWMGAKSQEELERFRESAVRHFMQWLAGETDEDHAAAVFFNINGYEYTKAQLKTKEVEMIRCVHTNIEFLVLRNVYACPDCGFEVSREDYMRQARRG